MKVSSMVFMVGLIVMVAHTSVSAVLVDFSRGNTDQWSDSEGVFNPPAADVAVVAYVNDAHDKIESLEIMGDVSFTLSTSATSDEAFNRDRTSSRALGPINAFFRDFVGAKDGDAYTLTLSGLAAGTYNFTSWHYDAGDNRYSDPVPASRDVLLTDAVVTDASMGTATSTAPSSLASGVDPFLQLPAFTFQLTSNGVDPVTVSYGGLNNINDFPINGFEITLIPEPATAMLLGLGGVLVARRRRGA